MLTSIEISGFKSFANKTQLDFGAPISAIVGPNGSGKSNAAEAFRFVLGEQSMKALRGKRTEDLLFNGTRTASRANRASVRATFDNSDNLLDVDYDEVVIERIIYRDSSAEYRINGSVVRLKDITELLSGANIGSSGHHIISQGEADRILFVSEGERKSMIEDALGLQIYYDKKRRAARRLERTKDNLSEVSELRHKLAPRLASLTREKKKIEEAQELKERLFGESMEYFIREKVYLDIQSKKLQEMSKDLADKLEKTQDELRSKQKYVEDRKQIQNENDKLIQLREHSSSQLNEREKLSRKLGQIDGQITSLKEVLESSKNLSSQKSPQAQEKVAHIPVGRIKKLVQGLKDRVISALEGDLGEKNSTLKSVLSEIEEFADLYVAEDAGENREDSKSSGSSTVNNADHLRSKIVELENEKEKVTNKRSRLEEKISATKENIEDEERKRNDQTKEYVETEKTVLRLEGELKNIEAKISSTEKEYSRIQELQEQLREDIAEAATLISPEVRKLEKYEITDDDGNTISRERLKEHVLSEDRKRQRIRHKDVQRGKLKLENMGVGSKDVVLNEYEEVAERDAFLAREMDDLKSGREKLETLIQNLEETLANKFHEGVKQINQEFKDFFSLMFGGGRASLEVVREKTGDNQGEQEIKEGVMVNVSLPRKNIKNLEMLSGGERALTSIALLFAITQVNPPPFIILDETDAALDEANSRRYGDMIEDLSKDSQLILVTHNRETMSRADLLYGVTMGGDGVSKLLSIDFEDAENVAK